MTVWIAVSAGTIRFGVTRIVDPQRQIGEIYMLAVDPMPRKALAMTKTGADPGQPRPGESTKGVVAPALYFEAGIRSVICRQEPTCG